jgi:transposase
MSPAKKLPADNPIETLATSLFSTNPLPKFLFEYFPAYSPELSPVEGCWNMMKNVLMSNFVPKNDRRIGAKNIGS